ncbi:MAG: tetraacyldisaccharide 4'-kinase [Planctomycetes bacterium]|nr:tetraacyldisaccharide 4'-kinase [Planctomycetota bacterium]
MNVPAHVPPQASPLPAGLRWLGPPLAACYWLAVALRRFAYRVGLKETRRAPMPVISVGNITAGGTGKTPFAAYLAKGLIARRFAKRPAILMRGYGAAKPGEPNDEALELTRALGNSAPVICNPNRYDGAMKAKELGCDVAILDDGFQHWQLARDLDIVLIDATDPLGGGHLLPWGRLREGPGALKRADMAVVARAAHAESTIDDIGITAHLKSAPFLVRHEPKALRGLFSSEKDPALEQLKGRNVLAACAIGNPGAFASTLRTLQANVVAQLGFSDHHLFTQLNLGELAAAAKKFGAEWIIVTEKDAVKLEKFALAGMDLPPVYALGIECVVRANEAELWTRIEKALRSAR